MKLTMLGTGNAMVTECYNTCFVIEDNGKYLMVDGGGGNTILRQLKLAGIAWQDIHEIFVTHKHVDHVMGIIWMIRIICQNMRVGKYEGDANIYAHADLIDLIKDLSSKLIQAKDVAMIGERMHLIPVSDGEVRTINGREVTFFDIGSTKAKQFGFTYKYADGKLACCGDEPYNECERQYVEGSTWLLHEAFCLYSQADIFSPYEKHHSTVKDACELATSLNVPNLLLYHTEDKNILRRKELYSEEGRKFYSGNLFIPDDLESIEI